MMEWKKKFWNDMKYMMEWKNIHVGGRKKKFWSDTVHPEILGAGGCDRPTERSRLCRLKSWGATLIITITKIIITISKIITNIIMATISSNTSIGMEDMNNEQ